MKALIFSFFAVILSYSLFFGEEKKTVQTIDNTSFVMDSSRNVGLNDTTVFFAKEKTSPFYLVDYSEVLLP